MTQVNSMSRAHITSPSLVERIAITHERMIEDIFREMHDLKGPPSPVMLPKPALRSKDDDEDEDAPPQILSTVIKLPPHLAILDEVHIDAR